MKQNITINIALFLCLILYSRICTSQSNIFYLSANGAKSDADLDINSVTFGTDNTAAIQAVLDKAKAGPIVVQWDGKYSVTGLEVYSNTTIIACEGCGGILRNNSNKPLLRNSDISFLRYSNSNIKIQGGIWNGNGFNKLLNPAQIHDNAQLGFLGWVSAIQFFGVENLTIQDATILKPRTFALHAGKVKNVFIQNVKIDVGEEAPINCDGLHFDGPSNNVTIKDCVIRAKDDHVAFNADEEPGGDITDITIDNITLDNGMFGIRLLTREYLVDRVLISNIHGRTQNYWLVADTYRQGYPKAKGNFGTVVIENINVESTEHFYKGVYPSYANIHANAESFIFKNINRNEFNEDSFPSILVSGEGKTVKKLVIEGYNSTENGNLKPKSTNHIEINSAKVNYLKISSAVVTREQTANASPLLSVKNGASVSYLQMNDIFTDGIDNLVDAQGSISHISASNIIHINATKGEGTFKIYKNDTSINFSTYTGLLPISGAGKILSRQGDAFTK